MNRKIDFLIIGAQKCGTTSLHDYLGQHPEIYMPERKDLPIFVDAGSNEVREQDFDYFYRDLGEERLIGGSFVHLLYHPDSPARVRDYNPDMRLIAVLRNPIERAYSAYWFARREGYETESSFESALAQEAKRAAGTIRDRNELTYLGHGRYFEQLSRYVALFDRSQIHVCLAEDLRAEPHSSVLEVLRWLGLDPEASTIDTTNEQNGAAMPRSRLLQRGLIVPPEPVGRVYRHLVPRPIRYRVDRSIIAPLRALNQRPFRYPPMDGKTREKLATTFAPLNAQLAELIGRDLSHWQ